MKETLEGYIISDMDYDDFDDFDKEVA